MHCNLWHARPFAPQAAAVLLGLTVALVPAAGNGQGVETVDSGHTATDSRNAPPTWLGVVVAGNASEHEGAPVERVFDGSPASRADLQTGDRIRSVAGDEVDDLESLRGQLDPYEPGDTVEVEFVRDGTEQTLSITLRERPSNREIRRNEVLGDRLPARVKLRPLDGEGEAWTRKSLEGKPLVLEFWATWCTPCEQTAQTLESLQSEFGDRVRIVGVSREDESRLEAYVREHDPGYPIALDVGASAHRALLVSGYPTLVVVDAQGKVRKVLRGIGHKQPLRALLESLVDS